TGNVVVRKPGTAGHENASAVILQAHLDMVNEKNSDVEHDFDKDPLQPVRDGEFLKASGTTLGSDNGIGMAAMLAVMEATGLVHGPLEFLFTIDEETGLTGAGGITDDMLKGQILLNLDSEDEGELTVGCAGGADSQLRLPLTRTDVPAGTVTWSIKLVGLKGGHSGVDIHLQRGNACKLINRALYAVSLETPFHLVELRGGDKHNAVPRESFVTVVVAEARSDAFKSALEAELAAIRDEFKPAEPNMRWEIASAAAPPKVWDEATTAKVMQFINALPHGVMAMSYDIPGLVETSTNLATVTVDDGTLGILMSTRSSVASALTALRQRIRAAAVLAGAEVEEGDGYPGWQPNMDSHILEVVKKVHERVLGTTPKVAAIHAGLECGIIGEKFEGMDMISFGPTIQFPHSPDEQVKIDTVGRFYDLLLAVLKEVA
ncbi:MAG: aminoacyl-histidine dipeptidase, partial [bacterium]|nr:aminoacyl-histidine dipeptidase [bacterium]